MSFVSIEFLVFIASLFSVYFLMGKFLPKYQWVILLIGSYVFYAFASLKFVPFLLASTCITWASGIFMGKIGDKAQQKIQSLDKNEPLYKSDKKAIQQKSMTQKKVIICIGIVLNLSILIILKYAKFLLGIFGADALSFPSLIFPLGISFYTFQSMGYCIDVYRGIAVPEKNLLRYALYVSYFPQISQGPIGEYKELAPQFTVPHRFSYYTFTRGLEKVLLGLFKKLFIADNIAICVSYFYDDPTSHLAIVMIAVTLLYAVQLYADFSGYMDIVSGVSECLGIKLAENFSTPYFSSSIAEFWRRWHISLGAWFRNYLYYPILRSKAFSAMGKALNKKGKKALSRTLPTVLALFVTWLLIGFWHGASWNFVAYGLYHGTFIILSTILSGFYDKTRKLLHIKEEAPLWNFFKIIRTFTIVTIGYVLFCSASLGEALDVYKNMLTNITFNGLMKDMESCGQPISYYATVAFSILIGFIIELSERKKPFVERINGFRLGFRWIVLFAMLYIVMIYALTVPADAGNFIYFNF